MLVAGELFAILGEDEQQHDADNINVNVLSSEGLCGSIKAALITNGNYDGLVDSEDWRYICDSDLALAVA